MSAVCNGTETDHCCTLLGVTCPFLRDDGPDTDRRWVCTLREELGSWNTVHADPRYLATVRPILDTITPAYNRGVMPDCGDWPPTGVTCQICGANG